MRGGAGEPGDIRICRCGSGSFLAEVLVFLFGEKLYGIVWVCVYFNMFVDQEVNFSNIEK